jgi:tRNA threonylcarbamoyladenosine biosynthesis protein TsaE
MGNKGEVCEIYLADEDATRGYGEELAARLEAGDCVALVGGLGAGKTRLVQGIARGLGCDGEVSSPTFTLVNEVRGGRLPLFHLDLYRLGGERELLDLGWDELLDEGAVVAVEWAERCRDLMPEGTRWITLEVVEGGGRIAREGGVS